MSGSSVNFHRAEPESIIAQQSSLWSPVGLINRAPFTGEAGDSWARNLHRGGGEATLPRRKTLTLRILSFSSSPVTGNVFSCHEKSPEAQLEPSALLINPGPQEYWLTAAPWLCDPHKNRWEIGNWLSCDRDMHVKRDAVGPLAFCQLEPFWLSEEAGSVVITLSVIEVQVQMLSRCVTVTVVFREGHGA